MVKGQVYKTCNVSSNLTPDSRKEFKSITNNKNTKYEKIKYGN